MAGHGRKSDSPASHSARGVSPGQSRFQSVRPSGGAHVATVSLPPPEPGRAGRTQLARRLSKPRAGDTTAADAAGATHAPGGAGHAGGAVGGFRVLGAGFLPGP